MADARTVADTIRGFRFSFADEDTLQEGLAAALVNAGFAVEREVRLNSRDRIDLLVGGRVGVEVKVAGAWTRVERQLARYARHPGLTGLVLVTSRATHQAPQRIEGMPLEVVNLAGARL